MQQPSSADKSMVQARVIVSAPNLDSFNASPSLLRMASSLMEDPSIAELINTPCETGDQSSQQNGDINLYGVKTLAKATAVADYGVNSMVAKATAVVETPSRSFYYRDPRLPEGWYVKVEPSQGGNIIVNYFTSNGDRLRSLSEVAHFLKNKLVTLPSCRGCLPPAPLSEIPRLDQLRPEDRGIVPTLVLPAVDVNSPVIRQIDSEIIEPSPLLKRPAPSVIPRVDLTSRNQRLFSSRDQKVRDPRLFQCFHFYMFKVDGISDSVLFNVNNITEEKLYHYIFYSHFFPN